MALIEQYKSAEIVSRELVTAFISETGCPLTAPSKSRSCSRMNYLASGRTARLWKARWHSMTDTPAAYLRTSLEDFNRAHGLADKASLLATSGR